MICLACRGLTRGDLCRWCEQRLRPAPDRWLDAGVLVRSAHLHDGPARGLVHRLKYDGLVSAAGRLAPAMVPLVSGFTMLVPIPRTTARRHRFGVDPALELARALTRLTGIPTVPALAASIRGPVHAGRSRSGRQPPRFRARGPVDRRSVLIDDVVTTGTTIVAAAETIDVGHAVTATSRVLEWAMGDAGANSSLQGSSSRADRPKLL